jgi:hypothetical protein
LARRVRLTARYLSDARRIGVLGGTRESRDVKRVIDVLAAASAESLEADVFTYVPSEGDAVRVLAHGRRVPRRNLWLWYWSSDDELTMVGMTNVPPVPS